MKIPLTLLMALLLPTIGWCETLIGSVAAVQREGHVIHDNQSEIITAKGGDAVLFLDTYKTGVQSKLKLLFEDDSILSLGERSRIKITESIYDPENNRRSTLIEMSNGVVRVLVGKLFTGSNSRFEIHTPTAVAAARGTYFIVWNTEVNGVPATGVLGLEGSVEVKSSHETPGESVLLTPNTYTLVGSEIPPSPPAVAPAELRAELMAATEVAERVESTTVSAGRTPTETPRIDTPPTPASEVKSGAKTAPPDSGVSKPAPQAAMSGEDRTETSGNVSQEPAPQSAVSGEAMTETSGNVSQAQEPASQAAAPGEARTETSGNVSQAPALEYPVLSEFQTEGLPPMETAIPVIPPLQQEPRPDKTRTQIVVPIP